MLSMQVTPIFTCTTYSNSHICRYVCTYLSLPCAPAVILMVVAAQCICVCMQQDGSGSVHVYTHARVCVHVSICKRVREKWGRAADRVQPHLHLNTCQRGTVLLHLTSLQEGSSFLRQWRSLCIPSHLPAESHGRVWVRMSACKMDQRGVGESLPRSLFSLTGCAQFRMHDAC